jgi:hypothetical protein
VIARKFEGLTQFPFASPRECQQTIGTTGHLRSNVRKGMFLRYTVPDRPQVVDFKRRDVGVVDRARLEIGIRSRVLTHIKSHQRTSDQRLPATTMCIGVSP